MCPKFDQKCSKITSTIFLRVGTRSEGGRADFLFSKLCSFSQVDRYARHSPKYIWMQDKRKKKLHERKRNYVAAMNMFAGPAIEEVEMYGTHHKYLFLNSLIVLNMLLPLKHTRINGWIRT